jgi:hypothetical protein
MRGSLFTYLYGSIPAVFESDFDLDASVERLAHATERSFLGSLMRGQAAEGEVSRHEVFLKRRILLIPNFYAPCFVGAFTEREGKVLLAGRFRAGHFLRIFFALYFVGALLLALLTAPSVSLQDTGSWLMPALCMAMLISAVILLVFYQRFARNDVAWLSDRIGQSLRDNGSLQEDSLFPTNAPRLPEA